MSDLSPLSGEERKSNFGAVRSVEDPCQTSGVINVRGRRQPKPKRSHAASSITCFVVLSITMGVSKYWNSGWHP
jgi:hypothetical protein